MTRGTGHDAALPLLNERMRKRRAFADRDLDAAMFHREQQQQQQQQQQQLQQQQQHLVPWVSYATLPFALPFHFHLQRTSAPVIIA